MSAMRFVLSVLFRKRLSGYEMGEGTSSAPRYGSFGHPLHLMGIPQLQDVDAELDSVSNGLESIDQRSGRQTGWDDIIGGEHTNSKVSGKG
jgi:hypothetical protein